MALAVDKELASDWLLMLGCHAVFLPLVQTLKSLCYTGKLPFGQSNAGKA